MSSLEQPVQGDPVQPPESGAFLAILKMLGPVGVIMQEGPNRTASRFPCDSMEHLHRYHRLLSRDERTPARLLAVVAKQTTARVLERIAEHPQTSVETLH